MTTKTLTYKWTSAQEWLQQYLNGLTYTELQQEARNLASKLDNDTIQEIYESDMDMQGFFTPLERDDDDDLEMSDDSCGECGHPYKRGDETHYPECSRINIAKEWSGACDPCDPANYWIDDETGERVSAATGERTEHDCPMFDAEGKLKDEYDQN